MIKYIQYRTAAQLPLTLTTGIASELPSYHVCGIDRIATLSERLPAASSGPSSKIQGLR
jgi:hypothetical protein